MLRPRINMVAVVRWLRVKMRGNPYRFGPLVYLPSKCKTYQRLVAKSIPKRPVQNLLLEKLVAVYITVFLVKPKKFTPHSLRPDLDHYANNVLDGMNQSSILADDAFVQQLSVYRKWCLTKEQERTEVTVVY